MNLNVLLASGGRPVVVSADPVGVLDTSTLILIERLDPESLSAQPVITAVTLAESSVGPLMARDGAGRSATDTRDRRSIAALGAP